MKKLKIFLTVLVVFNFSSAAEAGWLSKIIKGLTKIPVIGGFVDNYANRKATSKVNSMIDDYYGRALSCNPLENDNGRTVQHLIQMKPGFPDWQTLERFESVSQAASTKAAAITSDDKMRHCYAGCEISKNLNPSAGILAAFMKELKDASDCSSDTHFEFADYSATVFGATTPPNTSCQSRCIDGGEVQGFIDMIDSNGFVYGWACLTRQPQSIDVHIYAGGPAGSGGFIAGSGRAREESESAVGAACLDPSNSPHRFKVQLSENARGQRIYVHAINGRENPLISRSGLMIFK